MRDTIQQLDELHTATTQGKWVCRRFEGVKFVEPGMTIDDWQFCCDSHSAWTEISEKLKRLRAWKQEAIEMIGKGEGWEESEVKYLKDWDDLFKK